MSASMRIEPMPLRISALADKHMRNQLGALCVHWALLELIVERVIAAWEGRGGKVEYKKDLAKRLPRLKELAREKLPVEQATAVENIASQIHALGHRRHHVVHGLWGIDENGNFYSVHPRTKLQKVAVPQNAQTIREIKLEAHRLFLALEEFAPPTAHIVLALPNKQWPAIPRNLQSPAQTPSAEEPQPQQAKLRG